MNTMKKNILLLAIMFLASTIFAQSPYPYQNGGGKFNPGSKAVTTVVDTAQIQFWVGQGSNRIAAGFYFCNDDNPIGVVYGYAWNGTKTIQEFFNEMNAADSRINVSVTSWVEGVTYQDSTYNLAITGGMLTYASGSYWYSGLNDNLQTGDAFSLQEWGGCTFDNATLYYVSDPNQTLDTITPPTPPTPPTPIVPDTVFDGIVGTPGCQAIHCEDPAILGWATGCQITRGYQDIASPTVLATYGTDEDGTGAASTVTTTGVVSLGDGGTAVLTFGIPIQNGDGYDFAVFENALNDTFLELAFVEVSSDGERYVRFPATSNTQDSIQIGNGGSVDATKINNLAGKYRIGWGTPFDLDQLSDSTGIDINNITHVRLIDVVGSIDPQYGTYDQYGQIINDPYPTPFASSGFDLSGVAVLNGWTPAAVRENPAERARIAVYPNPASDYCTIVCGGTMNVAYLYDISGKLVRTEQLNGSTTIDLSGLENGFYLLNVNGQNIKIIKQ